MMAKLILFFIFIFAGTTRQQSITWVDPYRIYGMYYQPGLIQNRDAIILYGEIDMGQTTVFDRAHYEIKRHSFPYTTLCYLDLTKCEGYKHSFCYCKATSLAHVFDVIINITADTTLSEAKVKGALYTSDKRFDSVEKSIPKIYDGKHIELDIYINGQIANGSRCESEITGNIVFIVIQIPDIVNLHYQLVLRDTTTNMILRNESKTVLYSTQLTDTLHFTVHFKVFDLAVSEQHIKCSIQGKSHDEKDRTFIVLFAVVLVFLALVVLLVLFCLYCRKPILSYMTAQKTKTNSHQPHKQESNHQNVNAKNEEELISLVSIEGQGGVYVNVETSRIRNVAVEVDYVIPKNIIAKIQEIQENKDNKTHPIANVIKRVSRLSRLSKEKYDVSIDLVQYQLEIMVRVDVNVVSNRRPNTWPGIKTPFPYCGKKEWKRTGYGRILSVSKFTNKDHEKSHVWKTSRSTLDAHFQINSCEWIEVLIYVSRHLVFDDFEAKQTTCNLIMNTDPLKKVQFQGVTVRMANVEENWTLLTCISKDIISLESLQESLHCFNQTWPDFDTSKAVSFFVFLPDMNIKKTNFGDMFGFFNNSFKTSSFFLNTYFEKQEMVIYFERARAYLKTIYQKEADTDCKSQSQKLELCSMPLIIQTVQTKTND